MDIKALRAVPMETLIPTVSSYLGEGKWEHCIKISYDAFIKRMKEDDIVFIKDDWRRHRLHQVVLTDRGSKLVEVWVVTSPIYEADDKEDF